jgi:hypothetical protein
MKAMLRILGALVILVVLFVVIHPSVVRGQNGDQNSNAVTTQGYDNNRDNVNSAETVFLATNFSFAKTGGPHISIVNDLHGIVYAQPLYLPQIPYRLNADLLYVATEENWIYAMDANNMPFTTSNTWSDDFNQINCPSPCTDGGDTIFGPVPDANLSDKNLCTNIQPEVGITGTPVIDFSSSTVPDVIYAVSDHYDTTQNPAKVRQFLNAVSVKDGSPVAPSIDIAAMLLSTLGFSFDASAENQRAGLALTHDSNGNPYIYVAWAGYCDNYNPPGGNPTQYTGLVAVFEVTSSPTTLTPVAVFNDEAASMGQQGGIWMGGAGPAIDDVSSGGSGDVYISTGNGLVTNPSYNIPLNTSANNLGMSILQLSLGSNTLAPVGAYTANEWSVLNCGSGMGPTCSNQPVCKNVLHLPYYPTLGVNPTFCSLGRF